MYKINIEQNRLMGFNEAIGFPLDSKNEWVRIADMISWEKIEKMYADKFPSKTGTVAKPCRLMLGALIIQIIKGLSERDTVQEIMENPYLQYFVGFPCFTTKRPFCPSLLTKFKKRLDMEMVREINEIVILFRNRGKATNTGGRQKNRARSSENEQTTEPEDTEVLPPAESKEGKNSGTLILDATCAPQNISYPQDTNLLNEARKKLERIIDDLCYRHKIKHPRTYRKTARKEFLNFTKSKKPSVKKIRKAKRQQLQYIRRNRKHIDKLIGAGCVLTDKQKETLENIDKLTAQQQEMYDKKQHRVADRIVSLSQPHVRPIVRGKATAPVEFGAKLEISVDEEGDIRLEKVSFDAYNESETLIPAAEAYFKRTGHYPERILADKIYRNKKNIDYCKEHGIRLSGSKLGRPPKDKETRKEDKKIEYQDNADRTEVERDFALGKQKYGLGKITAKLEQTSAVTIAMIIVVMNIKHILRTTFLSFLQLYCFAFKRA